MVYILLAEGFEEVEALTACDLIRRADIPCALVSDSKYVTGSHGIKVAADISFDEIDLTRLDAVVLPGGIPGVDNLENNPKVQDILRFAADNSLLICAICAAPRILGNAGYLEEKHACCYPGFEKYLKGAKILYERAVKDGNFITSRGAGTAVDFALEIVSVLKDKEVSERIGKGIIYEQR